MLQWSCQSLNVHIDILQDHIQYPESTVLFAIGVVKLPATSLPAIDSPFVISRHPEPPYFDRYHFWLSLPLVTTRYLRMIKKALITASRLPVSTRFSPFPYRFHPFPLVSLTFHVLVTTKVNKGLCSEHNWFSQLWGGVGETDMIIFTRFFIIAVFFCGRFLRA